jgi:sugar lactone lactonase YvrE
VALVSGLTLVRVPGDGAEDVLVDAEGWVITATDDGSVFRVHPEGRRIDRVGNTGGRPLGLELLADGRVLVCDASRGLLALDPATGAVEELVTFVHGQRMRLCNNAAVHSDGTIFFTDSSRVYDLEHWKADVVENTCSGRLLRRDLDGSVRVLLDGLRFANGVTLAADESYVAVAESGGRSVVRLWLAGPRSGERDHLAADLPGYPDNLSRGSDGLVWVALAEPTGRLLEWLMTGPMVLRRLAWRLPKWLQPRTRAVWVVALDDAGRVVHDCRFPAETYHMVTGVREHRGRVWLGSVEEPAVAFFDLGSPG